MSEDSLNSRKRYLDSSPWIGHLLASANADAAENKNRSSDTWWNFPWSSQSRMANALEKIEKDGSNNSGNQSKLMEQLKPLLEDPGTPCLVAHDTSERVAHKAVADALRKYASERLRRALEEKDATKAIPCFFVVEVPSARSISLDEELRRILRLAYFQGSLLGLAASPELRPFMTELRKAYFQTRGEFSESEGYEGRLRADVNKQFGVEGELKFLATTSVQMERLGTTDAEDLLSYVLRQLELTPASLGSITGHIPDQLVGAAGRWYRWLRDQVHSGTKGAARPLDFHVVLFFHGVDDENRLAELEAHLQNIRISVPASLIITTSQRGTRPITTSCSSESGSDRCEWVDLSDTKTE